MSARSERHFVDIAVTRLAELLGQEPTRVLREPHGSDHSSDVLAEFRGVVVIIECKRSSDVASVSGALRALPRRTKRRLPVLAVPFMGEAGRRICEEAGVSWLDLSGNAHIVAPGLRMQIEGKPNLFKRAGRPSTVFAPKSARIARWLLMHPGQPTSQGEVAAATGMDRGFTSRIARRLVEEGLVDRQDDGTIVASEPDVLLRAWEEKYDWSKHRVFKGVVAARSGTELSSKLGEALAAAGVEHAFTGLPAAWQYDHFATYRLATVYLPGGWSKGLESSLGMREGERGANTWVVVPRDDGVMHGAANVGGLPCVHPVQVWLDLRSHPERAREAREHLQAEHLRWTDG
jgi:hypothetical protein